MMAAFSAILADGGQYEAGRVNWARQEPPSGG